MFQILYRGEHAHYWRNCSAFPLHRDARDRVYNAIVARFSIVGAQRSWPLELSDKVECEHLVERVIYCSTTNVWSASAVYIISLPMYLLFWLKSASYRNTAVSLSTLKFPFFFSSITLVRVAILLVTSQFHMGCLS